MIRLLQTYGDVAAYVVINFTDDLKADLLAKKALVQLVDAKARHLYSISFFDGRAHYYKNSVLLNDDPEMSDRLTDVEREALGSTDALELSEARHQELFGAAEEVRTECDELVLTNDSFYWRALIKHANDEDVETPTFPYDTLLK